MENYNKRKGYMEKMKQKKSPKHDFLSEELLVPGVNMCDTMRINMFDNHLLQSVVLKETDSPKVFTNFENQVGSISSAIKIAKGDLRIVAKFSINKFKTVYILANDDKKTLDVFISKEAFWLTEHYGWKNTNYIDEFEVGEVFPKGEPLSANTSYDEEQNFGYGRNLNAVFLPYKNLTYEDAIIVSENTAKKMSSYNIHQIDVTVNTNDILLNLYGTGKYYKSFPEVGEEVNKKVLCARRRISYNSALAELKNSALAKLNPHTDTAFYVNGKIVDIEIFSNQPIEELKKHKFFRQEYQIVKQQLEYATDFIKVVDKIETSKKYQEYTLLDDLNYEYKKCMLAVDDEKKWVNENKEFNYLVYRFTVMEESPLKVGNKITNRYGGKGVISKILPDEEMPVNQYGERADIILNILGVINRTNIGQLIELEINFISREIERYIEKHIDNREKIEKVLFTYLKIANSEQCKFIKEKYDAMQEPYKVDFWREIVEDGIYIHHPPFYSNINIDKLSKIYKIFDKIIKPYSFKGIKQQIIMGKMYYMRLKHDSFGKFSARSARYLNLKKVPAKSRSFKDSETLFSSTPLRLGEMEVSNLMALDNVEELVDFLKLYSSNDEGRHSMIVQLLLATNPFFIKELKAPSKDSKDNIRKILDEYLLCLGIELEK